MTNILEEILARKRVTVEERRRHQPLAAVLAAAERADPPRDFAGALRGPGVSVIAEFKRRSPSGGDLRPDARPGEIGQVYANAGAAALSVLTDEPYFGGSHADLAEARHASGLPALDKDFLVDEYQVYAARAAGADAVLLIVRALVQAQLERLLRLAAELQLAALVETHSADEVRRALDAGARIVGVNNRDLDTLTTDTSLALSLREQVPADVLFVAESGIRGPEQVRALAEAKADAILVGESLMRAPDPGAALRLLVEAGRPAQVGTAP